MFWDNFVKACSVKGLTPTGAMKKMGVSTGNIHRWQNSSGPSAELLMTVSEYLGVSIDYLLTGKAYNQNDGRVIRTDAEYTMITLFRKLPHQLQSNAVVYLRGLSDAYLATKSEGTQSQTQKSSDSEQGIA